MLFVFFNVSLNPNWAGLGEGDNLIYFWFYQIKSERIISAFRTSQTSKILLFVEITNISAESSILHVKLCSECASKDNSNTFDLFIEEMSCPHFLVVNPNFDQA